MAKGTAYIYFATKETLFVELVRAELTQCLAALAATLKRLRSNRSATAVPVAIAKSLANRPVLCRLLVLQTHALVISITQLASPPPVVARVIAADPSLHMMQIDFEAFLALTLTAMVRGVLRKS